MKFAYTAAIVAAATQASETESFQYASQDVHQECPDLKHLEELDTPDYQA